MMNRLQTSWTALQDKVHALAVRERVIITVTVAVLLLGLFDQILLRPWMLERNKLQQSEQQLTHSSDEVMQKLATLEAAWAHDPDQQLKDEIAQLDARHQALDADIAKITDGMVAPERMAQLLGQLLSGQSGLRVQSIKSSPAVRALAPGKKEAGPDGVVKKDSPAIYRHDLVLRLHGSYAQMQQYVHSIEALPQKLVWDELEFAVENYPQGELHIAVHTLSAKEELIRVAQ